MKTDVGEIIQFWFSNDSRTHWFNSTPAFDQIIVSRFLTLYESAKNDELSEWVNDADGVLALIILLDQFPLNMFRGKAECFETEAESRRVANYAIEQGLDEALSDEQKAFLYMPLMHSENLLDQDKSIALYEKAGLNENVRFAKHHREIIKRFARFPHRNAILGRENTPEEVEYLNSEDAFLG